MVRISTLILVFFVLNGCSSKESPSQVYERYNKLLVSDMDYKTDLSFYTHRKQQEIEQQLPKYMRNMHMNRQQVEEMYLVQSRNITKCKALKLLEEKQINPKVTFLLYEQREICGGKVRTQEKQKVRMFDEGGWKIDDIEFVL